MMNKIANKCYLLPSDFTKCYDYEEETIIDQRSPYQVEEP